MTPQCVWHPLYSSGWQETVSLTLSKGTKEGSKEQERKSRHDGRRESILWKHLLITSANFALNLNDSVTSIFSKDSQDEG